MIFFLFLIIFYVSIMTSQLECVESFFFAKKLNKETRHRFATHIQLFKTYCANHENMSASYYKTWVIKGKFETPICTCAHSTLHEQLSCARKRN